MTYPSVLNGGAKKRASPKRKASKRASPKQQNKGMVNRQLTRMRLNENVVNKMLIVSIVFQAIVLIVCLVDSDYLEALKHIFEGRTTNPDFVMAFISPVIMLILSILILVVKNSMKNHTVLVLLSLLGVALSITFMTYTVKHIEGF